MIDVEVRGGIVHSHFSGTITVDQIVEYYRRLTDSPDGHVYEYVTYDEGIRADVTVEELKDALTEIRTLIDRCRVYWTTVFVMPRNAGLAAYVEYTMNFPFSGRATNLPAGTEEEALGILDNARRDRPDDRREGGMPPTENSGDD